MRDEIGALPDHPLIAAGATAAAVMVDRRHPADIPDDDLPGLADRIIRDAADAARATPRQPGAAWGFALSRCFPNSPPVHPARGRWSDAELEQRLAALFAPDEAGGDGCTWCGQPASEYWAKGRLPLWSSDRYLNDGGGVPMCQRCRIYTWCLPYASAHGARRVVTVTSLGSYELQRHITAEMVARNRDATDHQWAGWELRGPWVAGPAILEALTHYTAAVDVHQWYDDNRESDYRVGQIRPCEAAWYQQVADDDAIQQALDLVAADTGDHPAMLLADDVHEPPFARLLHACYTLAQRLVSQNTATAWPTLLELATLTKSFSQPTIHDQERTP